MKIILLFLALFSLALSANAQQPVIKFYLEDGTTKEYSIEDIDSFAVSRDNLYVMHIYYQDTKIVYYPNEIIQSIKFEEVSQQGRYLSVNIFGYPKHYFLFDIDSIIFKIDKWQPLTIGNQVWMLKNLDVDHYRNGDSIPEVRDPLLWKNLKTEAWCYYDNDPAMGAIYGRLYNWYAVVDSRGLAPSGWHVPSDTEWTELVNYLGDWKVAGGKMKSTGTIEKGDGLWYNPNKDATNESGFTALPGGRRNGSSGRFELIMGGGSWWSATEYSAKDAWYSGLGNGVASVGRLNFSKGYGYSVRCVKD